MLLNSVGFSSQIFTLPTDGTSYYLVIKHRNSIETWSATGVQFTSGNLTYDFTSTSDKAYGNNLKINRQQMVHI